MEDRDESFSSSQLSVADVINAGETSVIEFKSTLRTNLHTGDKDQRMETAVLKTIAAFLNSHGGALVIGIADNGSPVGIEADKFENEDKMSLHLINLLKDRMIGHHPLDVELRFDEYQEARVLTVTCARSSSPVFVKDGSSEKFFVRYGPSTQELIGATAQDYIRQRFR